MTIPPGTGLAGIQRRQTEVGRIRLGISTPTGRLDKNGNEIRKAEKSDRFRFTSQSEMLIRAVARLYGGTAEQWTPQGGGPAQWAAFADARSIPVVVGPGAITQYYEQWAGGKCTRRCTGETELLTDTPCPCNPDARRCKATTRVSMMLSEVPGVGLWRLETHGIHAALELPTAVGILNMTGGWTPAILELQERQTTQDNPKKPGETIVVRFHVPVLHATVAPIELLSGRGAIRPEALGDTPPDQPAAVTGTTTKAIEPDHSHLGQLLREIEEATTRDEMQLLKDQITTRLRGADRKTAADVWSARARQLAATTLPIPARVDEPTQPDPSDKPTYTPPPQPDKPGQHEPTPADKPSPAEPHRTEPDNPADRLAAFQVLLGQAAAHGWDTALLTTRFEESMGVDRYDATADQFREFAQKQGW